MSGELQISAGIVRYLAASLIFAGIFKYLAESSDICRHLQLSSGISRYLAASPDIWRHLRISTSCPVMPKPGRTGRLRTLLSRWTSASSRRRRIAAGSALYSEWLQRSTGFEIWRVAGGGL
ncbi:hypothetical protein HOY80DRAFT_1050308 [Tuber brumale]|nr:hypothetical protein HOY80DRAFT_1050308 [Tuber brumale]